MKRIILVIPSLGVGGMERVMAELAHYFSSDVSLELHLVLYGIKRDIFYPVPENMSIHKPDFEFNNSARLINTVKTFIFLRKKIKNLEPAVVLSFGEYWNSFVLLAATGMRIPVFISDRCRPDKSFGKLHGLLRRWLYPNAAGVIAQTETAKQFYSKFFKHNNVRVIGNPIRTISSVLPVEKENIILSVGRLIKTKHHDHLIRIFSKINPEGWKLVIIGDDAIKQENKVVLQQLIQDLGMGDKIILKGQQSDIDSYYLKSKIFAFTSSSEGFPNVIGEALTAGLAVVTYDCIAGPADMIQDGINGFLIPVFDEKTFTSRLNELIHSESLQLKISSAAKTSAEQFRLERVGKLFSDFIFNAK
jgi:GalNAc-alpha-(1->4)-GalNAc-alpha-(1->3)-diNAcBac-PP-undecaprenol alpha-1,4-N-acetyl-D-galactosaminyltransferase